MKLVKMDVFLSACVCSARSLDELHANPALRCVHSVTILVVANENMAAAAAAAAEAVNQQKPMHVSC